MVKATILEPHLNRQVEVVDARTAYIRSITSGENISEFFKYLYASIYGGRVKKDPWRRGLNGSNQYSFNPDVVREEEGITIYTEIKATSAHSSQLHSRLKQEANNLCRILEEVEAGRIPEMEYALFKYGRYDLRGLYLLNNSQLVKTLARSNKELVVVPFNLFLHLTTSSRLETRDQTKSGFNKDSPNYHVIRGSTHTELQDHERYLSELREEISQKHTLKELCLDDLEVEQSTTPLVEGYYRAPFTVEPFSVTRYFVPKEKYGKLVQSLAGHRKELTNALGIPDVTQELAEKKARAEKERKKRLEEKLKNIPF